MNRRSQSRRRATYSQVIKRSYIQPLLSRQTFAHGITKSTVVLHISKNAVSSISLTINAMCISQMSPPVIFPEESFSTQRSRPPAIYLRTEPYLGLFMYSIYMPIQIFCRRESASAIGTNDRLGMITFVTAVAICKLGYQSSDKSMGKLTYNRLVCEMFACNM